MYYIVDQWNYFVEVTIVSVHWARLQTNIFCYWSKDVPVHRNDCYFNEIVSLIYQSSLSRLSTIRSFLETLLEILYIVYILKYVLYIFHIKYIIAFVCKVYNN